MIIAILSYDSNSKLLIRAIQFYSFCSKMKMEFAFYYNNKIVNIKCRHVHLYDATQIGFVISYYILRFIV